VHPATAEDVVAVREELLVQAQPAARGQVPEVQPVPVLSASSVAVIVLASVGWRGSGWV
jgi:hypothetical protein